MEGVTSWSVAPDARSFQHIASCTHRITPARGNARARPGHHLRTVIVRRFPHIAMRVGPYLHPSASEREPCVWPLRIPSTHRSEEFFVASPTLAATVHWTSQCENLLKTVRRQMPACLDERSLKMRNGIPFVRSRRIGT